MTHRAVEVRKGDFQIGHGLVARAALLLDVHVREEGREVGEGVRVPEHLFEEVVRVLEATEATEATAAEMAEVEAAAAASAAAVAATRRHMPDLVILPAFRRIRQHLRDTAAPNLICTDIATQVNNNQH